MDRQWSEREYGRRCIFNDEEIIFPIPPRRVEEVDAWNDAYKAKRRRLEQTPSGLNESSNNTTSM